ncbi:helix-turn-helix domain-containing protein [Deinococcus malanensis]|uniref:helix-turn-helix domain-containing protein n=1 Tax=Deinococcus malanensis TaxID=1706855 RepID=UPI003630DF53
MTHDGGFGRWVYARRRELGVTQKKLARLVGCSPVTIQKIEEGRRRPSPHLAEALATHLDITADHHGLFLEAARQPSPVERTPAPPGRTPVVPVPVTPLLGRDHERVALTDLLVQTPRRLVTLTGSPGVGKSRLAEELAHDLLAAFDEVQFTGLAALTSPGQVWPDVARGFGLSGGSGPLLDRLGTRLGRAGCCWCWTISST